MNHFPGTVSLIEQLDRKVFAVLRSGRQLVGTLRSFDQFSNLVFSETCERHVVGNKVGDIPLGLYILRGDNIVMIGEIDEEKEKASGLEHVSVDEILAEMDNQEDAEKDKEGELNWNFDKLGA